MRSKKLREIVLKTEYQPKHNLESSSHLSQMATHFSEIASFLAESAAAVR
jgi:hypothetical protein